MTPFEYTDELLKDFVEFATTVCAPPLAVPEMQYSKLGTQVIGCESLIFAATGVESQPIFENATVCGYYQVMTLAATLARDCAYEMDDDGIDDPEEVARISAQMDHDSDCLWEWAQRVEPYVIKDFSIGFTLAGGLAITSLQMTLGVP